MMDRTVNNSRATGVLSSDFQGRLSHVVVLSLGYKFSSWVGEESQSSSPIRQDLTFFLLLANNRINGEILGVKTEKEVIGEKGLPHFKNPKPQVYDMGQPSMKGSVSHWAGLSPGTRI
jgi:hypothetical protein